MRLDWTTFGWPGVTSGVLPVTPPAEPLFDFAILAPDGSGTITSVPNLRISIDAGVTWQSLTNLGLTVARGSDGKSLEITGFASQAARDAALFHYEQQIPGEPNSDRVTLAANLPALYFRRVSGPAPWNTSIPGMTVAATRSTSPIGVS